jgi:hypothetical protein
MHRYVTDENSNVFATTIDVGQREINIGTLFRIILVYNFSARQDMFVLGSPANVLLLIL